MKLAAGCWEQVWGQNYNVLFYNVCHQDFIRLLPVKTYTVLLGGCETGITGRHESSLHAGQIKLVCIKQQDSNEM